jgi:hypothetical protein
MRVDLQAPSRPILKMLRDARHDDKDEEKEKKMASGGRACALISQRCLVGLSLTIWPQSLQTF